MPGRHRVQGTTPRPYEQVVFDPWARKTADELMASHPGWLVVWGPYWRRWSAFALFTQGPLVLHEAGLGVLVARMRAVEEATRLRRT